MTTQQKKILLLGGLAAAVLIASGYFFGIRPLLDDRASNQAAAAAALTETSALVRTTADLQAKEADLPKAKAEMADLVEQFPTHYEQDEWLDMVASAARASDVRIQSVAPTTPVDAATAIDPLTGLPLAPPVDTTTTATTDTSTPATATEGADAVAAAFPLAQSTITLNVGGRPADIRRFVDRLEQMSRPVSIDSVSLTTLDGASTATIIGKTYLSRSLDEPTRAAADQ